MNYAEESLRLHRQWRGKIEIAARVPVSSREELALAYTPGVAQACLEIQKDVSQSFELTRRWNTCLVVTDGTAVLGLGDIGPEAGMPVMEGKCALFKAFGDVDAVPMCIRSKDVDEIVRTVSLIAGSFGGVNLEDIAAPRCFEIETLLKACCDIPVFHDDQHGTAVIVLAGLLGALELVGKTLDTARIAICGAGAAGTAVALLLMRAGARDVVMCDRFGVLCAGDESLSPTHKQLALKSNPRGVKGMLADAVRGADAFIGVSAANVLSQDMVRSMAQDAIVFACANPTPEIMPDAAHAAGARVVSTGRSDYPNQINNVLAFPGIFRGALDVRASDISDGMCLAAAYALSRLAKEDGLAADHIIPEAFDPRVAPAVARAVAEAALAEGLARVKELC